MRRRIEAAQRHLAQRLSIGLMQNAARRTRTTELWQMCPIQKQVAATEHGRLARHAAAAFLVTKTTTVGVETLL